MAISDPYLDHNNQVNRLVNDYERHNSLIVAFDFDNTVFDFHSKGDTFPKVIEILQECNRLGFEVNCFTAAASTDFVYAYCKRIGISIDNMNTSSVPSSTHKPYFNILLDDRAGLESAYKTLRDTLTIIRKSYD